MNAQRVEFFICACLPFLGFLSPAWAISIGPGAFGGGAIVESFEGLSAGPNIPTSSTYGSAYLVPGNTAPFTFGSGVTLTAPVPNVNDGTVVLVGDYALGEADWGLVSNGGVNTAADVPTGTAYLGDCCPDFAPIELEFSSDMLRVGIYATDAGGATITLAAYDSGGGFLESVSIGSVPVGLWGSNFLGIENAAGIRSITLRSVGGEASVPVYDDLTFESAIPEPSTIGLFAIGLLVLNIFKSSARKR